VFEGPYITLRRVPTDPGLYAIISYDGKQYYLLDVGYVKNIRRACQVNPRKECWEKHKQGNIHYAFLVNSDLDEESYRSIASAIRKKFKKIPCK